MDVSLKQLIKEVRELCNAHKDIKSFHYGDTLSLLQQGAIDYTTCLMNVSTSPMARDTTTFDIELLILDRVITGDNNGKLDAENTTNRIVRDLINVIGYSTRWRLFSDLTSQSPVQKYYDEFADVVTGWGVTISLQIYNKDGICDLPILGYDYNQSIPEIICDVLVFVKNEIGDVIATKIVSDADNIITIPSATCDPVLIQKSDGTLIYEAESGTTYNVVDSLIQLDGADGLELVANLKATDGLILKITNEDLETIPQVYVDGNNLVVEDKGIFNSNNTFSQAIDYINDNILDNVPNIDSDGSTVSTPAMIPFVCTPQAKELFLILNYKDDNDIIEVLGDVNNIGVYATIPTDLTYSLDGSNYIAIPNPFTIASGTLYYFKRGTATVTEIKTFIGTYV